MQAVTSQPLPGTVRDPHYPDSDGKPMGETDFHTIAVQFLRDALQDYFADRPSVYVATQLLLYYDRGNPSGRRDPDILIALNAGNHQRRSFRVWEEGALPDVVFEISSENTWQEDVGPKRALYQRLGIPEYFLFDAEHRWLNPALQGFCLTSGVYVPIPPGPGDSLTSAVLGVRFEPQGAMLRVIDNQTGVPVATRQERAEEAEARAEEAETRARRANERIEQLTAELERLRAQLGQNEPPTP
jgi:Uma2 family endonuclease